MERKHNPGRTCHTPPCRVRKRSGQSRPQHPGRLLQIVERLRRDGLGLVAVSYDPVAVLADFSVRRGISFPLLSDQGSVVIKRYGLLNTTVAPDNSTYGIPFPGTFIVNAKGVVTSRSFEAAYQERNTMTSILVKLGATLDVAATAIDAAHLSLTTYLTDQVAAPGTHFSAVVDATPAARVHVYAPGVNGYKHAALSVEGQPGLLVRDDAVHPGHDRPRRAPPAL